MKTLILHHVEPMWFKNGSPHLYLEKIIADIEENNYDKIILTTLENSGGFEELQEYITQELDWGYGWGYGNEETTEEVAINRDFEPEDIIEVSSHHQWAYLYPWIKDLKGEEIYLAGGSRYECLLDLQESLDHLGISYQNKEDIIFG